MARLEDLLTIVSQRTEHRRAYARSVILEHELIRLGGLDPTRPTPLELRLLDLYVPLKGRRARAGGDSAADMRAGGRRLGDEALSERFGKPEPILRLLQRNAGLIVLGAPGAGKSTLLKHLALACSCRILAEHTDRLGNVDACSRAKDLRLGPRLPLLVPLSEYALVARHTPLEDFVVDYFVRIRQLSLPMRRMMEEALAAGQALFLLDGLDEAGELSRQKAVVDGVVAWFHARRQAGNKCVVTSRIEGYRSARREVKGLVECTLLDFEREEMVAFARAFERAAPRAHSAAVARRQHEELLRTIDRNQGVRRLAVNPLLLTVLALFTRAGVPLPDRRIDLYRLCVDGLLGHWSVLRRLGQQPDEAGRGRSWATRTPEELRDVLAPLALRIQEQETGARRGVVEEGALKREVETVCASLGLARPNVEADQFIRDVVSEVGILAERAPGKFGFLHLTFQEYLAAIGIVKRAGRDPAAIAGTLLAHAQDATWREVLVLTIAYIGVVERDPVCASAVVEAMLAGDVADRGRVTALMGEAVADGAPRGQDEGDCVTPECRTRLVAALVARIRDMGVAAPVRAACGDALARVGDPRFTAARWFLPHEDLLGFVRIEPGRFLMGSAANDREASDDEKPQHEVEVRDALYMSRWPVTVGQFRAFVEDVDGNDGFTPQDPDCLRALPNHPVVNVSWHEAMRYCQWLTGKLRTCEETPHALQACLDAGGEVTLPSEAEWERAARGSEGRIYPWGNLDRNRANYSETGIGGTSAVGCFPLGATPITGLEDLVGNVWEWTRSAGKGYPYDPSDGCEDTQDKRSRRVLRGGSFGCGRTGVRAACRSYSGPDFRFNNYGFRAALCPFRF